MPIPEGGITFEVPNLDDASLAPVDYDRLSNVLHALNRYVTNKAAAMRAREDGSIQYANDIEGRNAEVYRMLPSWAKW